MRCLPYRYRRCQLRTLCLWCVVTLSAHTKLQISKKVGLQSLGAWISGHFQYKSYTNWKQALTAWGEPNFLMISYEVCWHSPATLWDQWNWHSSRLLELLPYKRSNTGSSGNQCLPVLPSSSDAISYSQCPDDFLELFGITRVGWDAEKPVCWEQANWDLS